MLKLITLALDRDPYKLYLIFLSREIDIQLYQIYTPMVVLQYSGYVDIVCVT